MIDATQLITEALTYDDVLLLPDYSEVLPHQIATQTRLTRNITLNIPLCAAAMDTVSEYRLAIAIAQEGGIAFIHKNMSIAHQAEQVRRVKRSESGMILDPITLQENATLGDAADYMRDFSIGGIPVIDENRKLKGIITNRDMRFEKNYQRPVAEVMSTQKLITAQEGIDLETAEEILHKYKIEKLPITDQDDKLVGLITYKDILKKKDRPNACKDQFGRLRVGAALGATPDVLERVEALRDAGVDVVSLDTAHGYSKGVLEALQKIKKRFEDLEVVAGNVATGEAAKALVDAGADGIKVGIGPGSICTTRVVAGVGVPQLSAVITSYFGIKESGVPIIADGGVRFAGDIVKALAAGADSVMIGSLLAGTEEAPGEVIIYEGRKFKTYRGMGSIEAMESGSKDRYFQEQEQEASKLVPEGIVGRIAYKGNVGEVVYQLVGGLRSGMGYCGSPDIETLKKAKFVRITAAGVRESHPHDVQIIREAPNYTT